MGRFLHFLVIVVSMLSVCPAAARDIFVNNQAGDDTSTGHLPQNTPDRAGLVQTIVKALRLARHTDRIVLAKTDQPYRESVSLVGSRHSGSSLKPFTIAGNGAILDGSAPVPLGAWKHFGGAVFRFRPPGLAYQQLFISDKPAGRVTVNQPADGPPKLEPLQWCLHTSHIYFCVEPAKMPEDYPLTYAYRRVGITLLHVEHVVIQDLTVQGFQLDGLNAYNSARRVAVAGVTSRGNGRSGVTVGGASLVDIEACLIGNNGRAQLLTLPWSETHVRNSQLLSNTAPAWVDQGGRLYIDQKRVKGGIGETAQSR